MFAVFMMGLALMAIISGAFSYSLILPDLIVIAVLSFGIYYFIIDKPKVFLWTMGSLIVLASGLSVYLYRNELLDIALNGLVDFFKPYYFSVSVEEFYIGILHQRLMIFIISVFMYKLIVVFYHSRILKIVPPLLGGLIMFVTFTMGLFSSSKDRMAFYLFVIALFIYYFEVFFSYLKENEGVKRRMPFYWLAMLMVGIVLFLSISLNNAIYNPFKERVGGGPGRGGIVGEVDLERPEIERKEVVYSVSPEYEVQTTFEHEGIQIFRVDTNELKYYKSQTFNTYDNGVWINDLINPVSEDGWPVEPILEQDIRNDDTVFYTELVEVIYGNVYTDSILSGPYTIGVDIYDNEVNVEVHEDGMFVADQMVGGGFAYMMAITIPKYRTSALMDFLESQVDDGKDLSPYLAMPEGYEDIKAEADKITEGISGNLAKAEAIEYYFQSEFNYNEEPNLRGDIIKSFVFDEKEGFCQQFATAMVLMLRSQGIPSRFVSGYVVQQDQFEIDELELDARYRTGGDEFEWKYVYDRDAHTWVEVYVPNFGWIQYEPTPGQSVIQFSDPLEYERELEEEREAQTGAVPITRETVGYAGLILLVGALIFVIVVFILRGKRLMRNLPRRLKVTYKTMLMYLGALGITKLNHETIREFGFRVDRNSLNSTKTFTEFVEMLEKAFYNDEEPSLEHIEDMEDFLADIKKRTKRSVIPLAYRRLRFVEVLAKHR